MLATLCLFIRGPSCGYSLILKLLMRGANFLKSFRDGPLCRLLSVAIPATKQTTTLIKTAAIGFNFHQFTSW
jgi:hypothetical protein